MTSLRLFLISILIAAACLGCSKSSGGPTNPSSFSTTEPTNADWNQLAGQLSAIAVDSVQQAIGSSLSTASVRAAGVSAPQSLVMPLTPLAWTNNYFCCGTSPSQYVTTTGRVDIAVDDSGTISVSETFESASYLSWSGPNGTYQVNLPKDGLRMTAVLGGSGGALSATQQYKIEGTLTYVVGNGTSAVEKTVNVSTTFFHTAFTDASACGSGKSPAATGQFGPLQMNNTQVSCTPPKPTTSTPPPVTATYIGTFASGMSVQTTVGLVGPGPARTCSDTTVVSGTINVTAQSSAGGAVTGLAKVSFTENATSCTDAKGSVLTFPLAGSLSNLSFAGTQAAFRLSFSGAGGAGRLSGILNYAWETTGGGGNSEGHASMTATVQ